METASPRGRSWLAGMLVVLLALCAGAMLKAFWSTLTPDPLDTATAHNDNDHLPEFDYDEALQVLRNPESAWLERTAAAKTVRRQPTAIPELTRMLDVDSPRVRIAALALLGEFGTQAADAGPNMALLCDHPDPNIRSAAVPAAWKVHKDRHAMREPLRRALPLGPDHLTGEILNYLTTLEPPCIEDVFPIAENKTQYALQSKAATYLSRFAENDPKLLRRMLKSGMRFPYREGMQEELERIIANEPDDDIHFYAVVRILGPAISRDKNADQRFETVLASAARHRDAIDGWELCNLLSRFDQRGVPGLRELLKSSQRSTRSSAARSVAELQPDAEELLPALRAGLAANDDWSSHDVSAVWILGKATGQKLIPELRALTKSSNPDLSRKARDLLADWRIPVVAP